MKKDGFTLLELLAVVLIVAVVGVTATMSFSNIEHQTEEEELQNIYIEIQRAANLYLDLHSSNLEWFIQNKKIDFKLADLKSENYIDFDLENPITNEPISSEYYVRLVVNSDATEVKSCIIDRNSEGFTCIANDMGKPEHCCE